MSENYKLIKNMKNIKEETFGALYDKIRDRLEKTNGEFTGFGVEKNIQKPLKNLWTHGRYWDSITLLICYHYSRSDSTILKISGESFYFRKNVTIREIAKILGITITGLTIKMVLKYSEFLEKYSSLSSELPELPSGGFKIGKWLEEKGINPGGCGHFCRIWKNGEKKKFITLIILYENSREDDLEVELKEEHWIQVKRNAYPYTIIEKIEEVEF